jgi:ribonuclease HI
MSKPALTIHIDGAARGNPGPAAYALVVAGEDGSVIDEKAGSLGRATNNVAEYTALLHALERAAELGAGRVAIRSDSELLVKQMNGEYRVKNEDLRALYDDARQLLRGFDSVTFTHVPRGQNSHADRLCNEELDGKRVPGRAKPAGKKRSPALSPERTQAVREKALDCLRAAAAAWARPDGRAPRVEDVWDQLWSILEEEGAVRPSAGGKG